MEMPDICVGIPSQDAVKDSSSGLDDTLEVIIACDGACVCGGLCGRGLDEDTLRILNAAAARETTSIAEDFEEFGMGKAFNGGLGADLTREHRGEFRVELY